MKTISYYTFDQEERKYILFFC